MISSFLVQGQLCSQTPLSSRQSLAWQPSFEQISQTLFSFPTEYRLLFPFPTTAFCTSSPCVLHVSTLFFLCPCLFLGRFFCYPLYFTRLHSSFPHSFSPLHTQLTPITTTIKVQDKDEHATNDHEQDPPISPPTSPSTISKPNLLLLPTRSTLDPFRAQIYPSSDPLDSVGQLQVLAGRVPCKDGPSDCIGSVVFDPVWAGVQD
ncbi:hypothetical protein BKA57DRAFT_84265 [Linnemannia elongata]|nr:hypothetical protein BKA57DRAFT_84265 [Linnemannia elongata]